MFELPLPAPSSRIASLRPALFNAGLTDEQQLRQSVLEPHKRITPGYRSVTVVLESGAVVSGRLLARTGGSVTLCTYSETNTLVVRDLSLDEVEQEDGRPLILESQASIMPTGFDKILTDSELDAVLTLIRQLN